MSVIEVVLEERKENAPAPPIAAALEKWQPPSPNKENVENKLKDAEKRRKSLSSRLLKKVKVLNKTKDKKAERKKAEDARKSLELSIHLDSKLEEASDKREAALVERVEEIAAKNNKKMLAATEAKHEAKAMAQDAGEELQQKLSAAQERRALTEAAQIEALTAARQEKMSRLEEAKLSEEHKAREISSRLQNKIMAASERRDRKLQGAVAEADKSFNIASALAKDEDLAKEIRERSEAKQREAAIRREKIISQKRSLAGSKGREIKARLQGQQTEAEMATLELRNKLESRVEKAAARRDEYIESRLDVSRNLSLSSSRFSSPSTSPISMSGSRGSGKLIEIEQRLEEAAARREAILNRSKARATRLGGGDIPAAAVSSEEEEVFAASNLVTTLRSPPAKRGFTEDYALDGQPMKRTRVDDDMSPANDEVAERNGFDLFGALWGHVVHFVGKLLNCFRF